MFKKTTVLVLVILLCNFNYIFAQLKPRDLKLPIKYINLGKKALLKKDILSANTYFKRALSMGKANPEANFYYAFTRLSTLPLKYSIYTLFKNMGFTGPDGKPLSRYDLDLFNFKAELPEGIEKFNLAVSFPNPALIQDVIYSEIIPEMDKAIGNLDLVLAKKGFVSYLSAENPITGRENIKIDYADAALLKSLICVIKSNLYELLVRNFDCDLSYLSSLFSHEFLSPEYILEQYPNLLCTQEIPHSLKAKEELISAIDSYKEAFSFMRAETDGQTDDLISIDPRYTKEARLFTEQITDIKRSLLGQPDVIFSMKLSQFINLNHFFANPFDFRQILGVKTAPYLLQDNFLPLIDYALNNLTKADVNYKQYFSSQSVFDEEGVKKEIDFADIVVMKSGLESLRMSFFSLLGYNSNVDVRVIALDAFKNRQISFNNLLNSYPDLLKLSTHDNIILAKQALNNVVKYYTETIDYLLNREDMNQTDDVLALPENFLTNEPKYKMVLQGLNSMQNTLIDPVINISTKQIYINTGEFFLNPKDIRRFLPRFDSDNEVIQNSLPDITFGRALSGYELPD